MLGVPWDLATVFVAVAAGYGAALVLHRLMSRFLEPDRALFVRAQTAEEPVGELLLLDLAEGGEPERFSEQIGQVNGPPAWAHR